MIIEVPVWAFLIWLPLTITLFIWCLCTFIDKWQKGKRTRKVIDCRWVDSCKCGGIKPTHCSKCTWYWGIDSGYGYCRALPRHIIVPWCKDVCSLFAKEKETK